MFFPYSKVLVIGATSGIGKALAARLVQNGTQVVIAGRRKENLEEFVKEHGSEKVKSKVFDVMDLEAVSCQSYLPARDLNPRRFQLTLAEDPPVCFRGDFREP